MSAPPTVAVIGAGEFGRALAGAIANNGHGVAQYSRSGRAAADHSGRGSIVATTNLADAARAELIFLAVPSPHVDEIATALEPHLDGSHMIVHVSRGLASDHETHVLNHHTTGLTTLSERIRDLTPCRRVGALAGPLVPESLSATKPGGAIVGTPFPQVAARVRDALASASMRIYETGDLLGVEVASSFVGVLAIGVGVARGLGVGPGAMAVLCTRGMAEAARVGECLGARPATFTGLSGFGDLVACVAGDGRAEVRLGEEMTRGIPLAEALERVGEHVEGVRLAARLGEFAAAAQVETPIIDAMAALAEGRIDPTAAVGSLMARTVLKE